MIYANRCTRLAILRVRHGPHTILASVLPLLTHIRKEVFITTNTTITTIIITTITTIITTVPTIIITIINDSITTKSTVVSARSRAHAHGGLRTPPP